MVQSRKLQSLENLKTQTDRHCITLHIQSVGNDAGSIPEVSKDHKKVFARKKIFGPIWGVVAYYPLNAFGWGLKNFLETCKTGTVRRTLTRRSRISRFQVNRSHIRKVIPKMNSLSTEQNL